MISIGVSHLVYHNKRKMYHTLERLATENQNEYESSSANSFEQLKIHTVMHKFIKKPLLIKLMELSEGIL